MLSLKIRLDILTMEKLLEAADKQASLVSTTPLVEFDEKIFQQFMLKNPVRDFHGVSREEYLHKSKAEKEQLVLSHYNSMINGEQFILLLISFKSFSNSFIFFLPNAPSKLNDV